MERQRILALLEGLQEHRLSVEEVLQRLKYLPFEDLGFAKVDHHRHLRRGFPEVVFGEGKSLSQIASIMQSMSRGGSPILVTRVSEAIHRMVRKRFKSARYHQEARAIVWTPKGWSSPNHPGIAVLAAGTSDVPVAEEAAITAELMGHKVERVYDVGVAGLHRLLAHGQTLQGARVLVVAAGMEGALPSVVAGLVDAPVIALPTSVGYGAGAGGIAALLAMLNSCAGGVLVVNIDNGFGAGLAAGMINSRSRPLEPSPKASKPPSAKRKKSK